MSTNMIPERMTNRVDSYQDSASYELISVADTKPLEVSLNWKNVKFSVKGTEILKGVSGSARPRELIAIMGSSGSGKTSLVSILSNQIIPNSDMVIEGDVFLNKQNIKNLDYKTYCRYVMQQDILLPTLTARESLMFTAALKLKGTTRTRAEEVEKVLEKLKLSKVADNIIGNAIVKGLSGGEKRRLCIGLEMISNPQIIILDEPTSGLDSYMAKMTIKMLKDEVKTGKTILMTIHQPGQEIYEMIDTLILMMAGHFVYQGPRKDALDHFTSLGYSIPPLTQPPDFFMRILHIKNTREFLPEEREKLKLFLDQYSDPVYENSFSQALPYAINVFAPGTLYCMFVLLRRSFVNAKRNPMLFRIKIAQSVIMSTIVSLLFRDLGYGLRQVYNRLSVLFFITVNTVMLNSIGNSSAFVQERPIFLKEYKEGLYGVVAYYYSKYLAEIPGAVIFSLIYSIVIYFSCDLNRQSAEHYFIFYSIQLLLTLNGMAFGNFAGVLAHSFGLASLLAAASVNPFMLFGGYFSNTRSLTEAFSWIKYISCFSRAFEAFVINEFNDLPLETDQNPIEFMGFHGELWQKIGALLLILFAVMMIGLITFKIKAEKAKRG